jgi:hypothetical protein
VYILFDPTRPKQTAIAATVGQRHLKEGTPVVYLFSRLDSERGWEHLKELNGLLKAPAYQLNKAIVERFAIRKLPASVSGSGDQLLVREYSVWTRRQHETHYFGAPAAGAICTPLPAISPRKRRRRATPVCFRRAFWRDCTAAA